MGITILTYLNDFTDRVREPLGNKGRDDEQSNLAP
jgi:hypothetical protein